MKTLSYIYGKEEEIEIGGKYYFGQLWDGDGDGDGMRTIDTTQKMHCYRY